MNRKTYRCTAKVNDKGRQCKRRGSYWHGYDSPLLCVAHFDAALAREAREAREERQARDREFPDVELREQAARASGGAGCEWRRRKGSRKCKMEVTEYKIGAKFLCDIHSGFQINLFYEMLDGAPNRCELCGDAAVDREDSMLLCAFHIRNLLPLTVLAMDGR